MAATVKLSKAAADLNATGTISNGTEGQDWVKEGDDSYASPEVAARLESAASARSSASSVSPAMGALSGGGASAGATPQPPAAANSAAPAMASLLQQQPDPSDVSQSGPNGLRPGLGMRSLPQYNYALASLQRGAY